jgi:hypothetical protein
MLHKQLQPKSSSSHKREECNELDEKSAPAEKGDNRQSTAALVQRGKNGNMTDCKHVQH